MVISGGGLYGISMLGVLRYLYIEKKIINIKYISCNSIGSLFGLIICLKIPIEDIEDLVKETTKENYYVLTKKNISNIFTDNGIFDISLILTKIKKYIEKKYNIKDINFIELSKKFGYNLYISATNINKLKNKIFSVDNTPNISIYDAVSASMALPFIFKPIKIDKEYYIDGIFSNNFPINIFKNIHKDNILAIAFKIKKDYYIKELEIDKKINFINYSKRLFNLIINNSTKITFDNYLNNYQSELLLIDELPLDTSIPIKINKNEIVYKFNDVDIDNLILEGFIKTSEFFNHIKKKQINKINFNENI
jgi:predicted acylesterase/phospholipase RssA|tara:strand:- start:90 stop:1013 length:924 start_codon:yes stop_codon:yes gene_type:complete